MHEAYKMVVVNIIGSLIVLGGVLFYRYVYPKKKVNLFVLLLIIGLLPILSLLRPGDYESGDFNIHIYRMMSFFNSLKDGILMPSWAGDLNATYGNPLFLFNYTLPYYAICILHFIGLSFITAYKLYLGLVLYFSGIFMYFFVKELTKNKLAAFASAIFYIFAPYHLIDVHFRATLGESTVFLLAPLLLLFLCKYQNNNRLIHLMLTSLFTYLLFLAHPLLAVIIIGISFLYVAFSALSDRKFKPAVHQFTALFFGIILSAYIWAPFIIYSPIMFRYPTSGFVGFYPFNLLFYSPWRWGLLFQGPEGELATIIGYTQLFVVVVSIILLIRNKFSKKIKKQTLFWVFIFLATLFMMIPISNIIWEYIPTIAAMLTQYSRLSLALALFTSIIAGYFVLHFKTKTKLVYFFLALTIGYTMLNWGQRTVLPQINDNILAKNVPYSTLTEGPSEYLDTIWADPKNPWFSKIPVNHLDILKGTGFVKEIKRNSTSHIYAIYAFSPLLVQENTLYFPGWTVASNGKQISVYPGYRGIITFSLPKGIQYVAVIYNDIFPINIFKFITLIGIIFIIFFIIQNYLKNLLRKA